MSAQYSYSMEQRPYLEGQIANAPTASQLSFLNPRVPQVTTLTVGGTASAGTYSVTVAGNGDNGAMTPFTFSFARAGSEDNSAIAAALSTAMNASAQFLSMFTASVSSAVVTVTSKRPTESYLYTTSAPGSGTLVAANTQTAGGTNIRVGSWVRRTSGLADDQAVVMASGATIAQTLGVVVRDTHGVINNATTPSLPYDVKMPGQRMSVVRRGVVAMKVWEAVTPDSTPYICNVVSGAAEFAGQMGASSLSSNAIDASSRCRYLSSAPAGGLALVEVTFGA